MKIMEEEKMTIKLPKDFFFGAAMSGPQTEGAWNVGGRLRSYWDMYSDQEINAFFNNVGSYVGNDMYHKYEEDIKLLKSLNFKSFRWTGSHPYPPCSAYRSR